MKKTLIIALLTLAVAAGMTSCAPYAPVGTSVGVSVGPRYGYGRYGYGYNSYNSPYYYNRPPVIVRPQPHYRAPVPRFYGGGHGYGRGGRHW